MFDTAQAGPTRLANARIVLPDSVLHGAVTLSGDRIAAIEPADGAPSPDPEAELDLGGQLLIPGVVDLHTDHVEAHVYPRASVQWPFLPALMAHDAVVVAGGTTTVFDSLSVGAATKRPERREILLPLVEAIVAGRDAGLFRAAHLVHLRCEISDPATPGLVDATIGRDIARLVSVMDHTPGDRQSPDIDAWFAQMIREVGIDAEQGRAQLDALLDRAATHGRAVRAHVAGTARAHATPLMSHDDRSVAHVNTALAEGATVAEFPTTLAAAQQARAHGMAIVAGAPNYLRGGSQSGNVGVAALLQAGLVDALASDYIPRSPLDAALAMADDPAMAFDLPAAVALISDGPARLAGLDDRGRIAPGLRADLVAVRRHAEQPVVTAVWRDGRRVF